MTLDELVRKYRGQLDAASNKKVALEKIIQEINGLTYTKNGQAISQETKRKILEELRQEVVNESLIHFAQDNSEFLELLNTTIKALGGK